jgi:hypothetical protein
VNIQLLDYLGAATVEDLVCASLGETVWKQIDLEV